jgi:HD-GYP domain-containing protein (c-di-GMP phosphodiesterase class II)
VLPLIRHHHERWDGTGYPDGLRGEQIPLLARVLQVADIYDALTNPRPYKPAFSHEKALQILEAEADRGWRDPEIVKVFLQLPEGGISQSPQGSLANLGEMLARDGDNKASGRISFRPLQFVPAGDSPEEATDRWRRE